MVLSLHGESCYADGSNFVDKVGNAACTNKAGVCIALNTHTSSEHDDVICLSCILHVAGSLPSKNSFWSIYFYSETETIFSVNRKPVSTNSSAAIVFHMCTAAPKDTGQTVTASQEMLYRYVLRCDRIFNDDFLTYLLLSLKVKEL